ncbi:hypothetical protein [Erwinia phage vB_Ea277G]|nr:hypothetical protein [Erwinia phage vB_Ea277G]
MADNKLNRPTRLLDDWNMRLFADPLNGGDKQPFMFWDFRYEENGKVAIPHIGVNLRTDDKNSRIDFYTDPENLQIILDELHAIASGTRDFFKVGNMVLWKFGKKLDKKELDVSLVIMRDNDGVFFGLAQQGRPSVKFYFKPGRDVVYQAKDGSILPNNEASMLVARAKAKIFERQFFRLIDAGYMDRDEVKVASENKRKNAFSGRNGGGNGGQGGGGWGKPQQNQQQQAPQQQATGGGWGGETGGGSATGGDFDSDIPF